MKELRRILMGMMLIFACTIMYAQTEKPRVGDASSGVITGSVVDEFGEGVIGATVKEKGTSNGTVTDFDGNFSLKAKAGAILVVSYIGYDAVEAKAAGGMKVQLK